MSQNIKKAQANVLKILDGQINDFYLAGGTPLALYYFQHRDSLDLDFFTHNFQKVRIKKVADFLSTKLKKHLSLVAEQVSPDNAKICVYALPLSKKEFLKIDFVEDYFDLIKPPKIINGINVLCLEDIYIRKIYAMTGTVQAQDVVGRKFTTGGRQEAKDYYDLYCLSNIFMNLAKFSAKYCNQVIREALIRWFRTYNRFDIKSGLLELEIKRNVEFTDMERHFKREIDKILEEEVDFL